MDTFLPQGFEPGLTRPRMYRAVRKADLCVEADGVYYPVLRRWATGFAVCASDTPELSGVVDLYDGAQHLQQCLITRKEAANGERLFTVKRANRVDYTAVPEFEPEERRV